jgi:hypothetical protein
MFRNLQLVAALLLLVATGFSAPAAPLAHMVYFSLSEPTEANRQALIKACHKHLSKHEGTTHFSVGVVAPGLDRPVNDRAFEVALHLVFDSREAHNKYQDHPRHLKFIDEVMPMLSKVRVFDADLIEPGAAAMEETAGEPAAQESE